MCAYLFVSQMTVWWDDGINLWINYFIVFAHFNLSYHIDKGLMVVSGQVIIELCDVDVFHT